MRTGKTKRGVDIRSTNGFRDRSKGTLWIVVGDRSQTRIFSTPEHPVEIALHKTLKHPAARRKTSELVSDKAGRSFDSYSKKNGAGGSGAARHGVSQPQAPKDHEMEVFAKKTATLVNEGRKKNLYQKLVLIMEPRFLGEIRSKLDSKTEEKIQACLGKDYKWFSDKEVSHHIEKLLK